jgi:S-adenosylmethionine decarboxylase
MLHVMLDLYGCHPDLLADETFLRQVLDNYPARIAMEKVSPVELRYIETSNPLDAGYSGFVIIATSHVSLHAWPPYGMVNIDIFSCEYFDTDDVVAFAKAMFQTDDVEVHAVKRATRSPRVPMRQEKLVALAPSHPMVVQVPPPTSSRLPPLLGAGVFSKNLPLGRRN